MFEAFAVFVLNHAVQRDVFKNPDLSHFQSPSVKGFACSILTEQHFNVVAQVPYWPHQGWTESYEKSIFVAPAQQTPNFPQPN